MDFALAFFLSALITPLCIRIAPIVGAMDIPGEARRIHTRPTPRIGGVGIWLSLFLSVFFFFPSATAAVTTPILLAGGALITAVGLTDDVFSLPPALKLAGQAAAALLLPAFGIFPREIRLFSASLSLSPFVGMLFSVFLAIALMNAANFIDGLDGLATCCLLPGILLCGGAGNFSLAGAASGFLLYNLPPARLFLGDSGSLLLGYSLSVFLLAEQSVFPFSRLLFAAIPLLDLCFAVLRRTVRGKSPFAADKAHFHHLLLRCNIPAKYITLLFFLLSVFFSFLAM